MAYQDYEVVVNFDDGTHDYDLPYVFHVTDPKEGMKATIIQGNRGDGAIVIPGGKKSQTIEVRGKLYDADGYEDITTLMNTMRSNITTDVATLTLKHRPITGGAWTTDWSYTVRRISEIEFPQSMRVGVQEYRVAFLVLAY